MTTATVPERAAGYKTARAPGHPVAWQNGDAYVHRVVLYDKIGPGVHLCHWCGRELQWNVQGIHRLIADHLDGDTHNNAPGNLVPSCRRCNSERSRRPDFLTHCDKGHEFTPENTYHPPKRPHVRECRICMVDRERATQKGFDYLGAGHISAKLTADAVRDIRQRHATGASMAALAREFGLNPTSVRKVVLRKTWSHVAEEVAR